MTPVFLAGLGYGGGQMTEIRFYHVQRNIAASAAPSLIQKALDKGLRIFIKVPDMDRQIFYDDFLWRHHPSAFLAHGQDTDPMPDIQPVLIGTEDRAANAAKMALVVDGAGLPPLEAFELVCVLFDSENVAVLERARQQWKKLKDQPDLVMTYWKQETNGAWSKQDI